MDRATEEIEPRLVDALDISLNFTGFGLGSLLFGWALQLGFTKALVIFVGVQSSTALFAIALFRSERSDLLM